MRVWYLCLLLIGFSLIPSVTHSESDIEWETVSFTLDNDFLSVTNKDRYYTNGLHLRFESRPFEKFTSNNTPSLLLPLLNPFPLATDTFKHRTLAYQFGQIMFTPENISSPEIQPDDIPYSGLLYAAADFSARNTEYAETIRFTAGVVGPWSQADEMQSIIHSITGSNEPGGWDHQLHNEFVLNLMYERRTPFNFGELGPDFNYQWINIKKAELGTINTGAEVSIVFLVREKKLKKSYDLQSSVAQNSYLFRTDLHQGYFSFIGLTGRLTLRNIFLDGNTFRDSPSVEKELLSAGVFYGIGYAEQKWSLSANWVREGKRFETQDGLLNYGSITYIYRY